MVLKNGNISGVSLDSREVPTHVYVFDCLLTSRHTKYSVNWLQSLPTLMSMALTFPRKVSG